MGFEVSGLGPFVIPFGDGFAHGLPFEFHAVGIVDDAVEDGIREGRLADNIVPCLDGQLAGDHGRGPTVSLFDDLHQVAALGGGQPVRAPVIEDQQLGFRDAAEQAGETPVTVGQFQLFEQTWHPLVNHGDAVAAGGLRQGAAEPGLADPAGTGDDQVALVGDPSAGEQALEQRLVEAAPGAVIDIFRAGADMAQSGSAQAGLIAPGLPAGSLAIEEQAQPFGMGQIGGAVLSLQVGKGFGHAVEAQGFQGIVGWVDEHEYPFSVEVIGATDVDMSDGRLLRGADAGLAIEPILQDRMDR